MNEHPHEALSAYLDGELASDERAAVEQHLRGCAGCSTLLEDLRRMADAYRAEAPPPVPGGLAARIVQGATEAKSSGPRGEVARPARWRRFRMPLAAAATLSAVALLWMVRQAGPDLRQPPQISEQLQESSKFASPPPAPVAEPEDKKQEGTGQKVAEQPAEPAIESLAYGNVAKRSAASAPADQDGQRKDLDLLAANERRSLVIPEDQERDALANKPAATATFADPGAADPGEKARSDEPAKSGEMMVAKIDTDDLRERAVARQRAPAPPQAVPESVAYDKNKEEAAQLLDQADRAAGPTAEDVAVSSLMMNRALALDESRPPVRTLWLNTPDYRISVTDAGFLMLESGEYRCLVQAATPAQAGRYRSLKRASASEEQEEDEIASLFRLSSALAAEGGAGGTRAIGGVASPDWSLTLRDADGTVVPLHGHKSGEDGEDPVEEVRTRLRSLALEAYRPLLEEQCGALPDPVPIPASPEE